MCATSGNKMEEAHKGNHKCLLANLNVSGIEIFDLVPITEK